MTLPPKTITIGSFGTNSLTAQPYGYEGDARQGLTAYKIRMSGLLTPAEWVSLLSVYNSWRDQRILDPDTLVSENINGTYGQPGIGHTVNVEINGANTLSVSNFEAWFADPPVGEQVGAYINATVTLVNAYEALQVLLRTKQKSREESEAMLYPPEFGVFGQADSNSGSLFEVALTKESKTRQDGPNVTFTAGGKSFITGPLVAHKVQDIEGFTTHAGFIAILNWYDTAIASAGRGGSGGYFPLTAPVATAEVIIQDGLKKTRYKVNFKVAELI